MNIDQLIKGLDNLVAENRGKRLSPEDLVTINNAADLANRLRSKKKLVEAATFNKSIRSDDTISFAPGGGCPCCGR